MKDDIKVIAQPVQSAQADAGLLGIVGALMLGTLLLCAAGFAQASVLHDTAHDMRHAMSFPCH